MRPSRPAGRRPGLTARLSLTSVAGSRSGAMLMAIGAVDSIGTALYLAGGALFFTRIVGLSTAQVGIGLSAGGLVGLAAQTPIGRLADRFGARRVLIIMNLGRAAGFTLYVFASNFTEMLLIASVLGIGEQAMFPVYQAVVEQAAKSGGQVALMARIRVVYNIGFTAGGALAGVGLSIGTRTAFAVMFLANALTFVIAAVLLPYVPLTRRPAADAVAKPSGRRIRLVALRDWPYLRVSALNSVLTLHISLLSIAVPLWAVQHTRAPDGLVGPLLIVNTLLAVVFQVRATRGTDTVPGAATALLRASLALAACCVLFSLAPSLPGAWAAALLVAAVAAMTVGELYQSAGGWGLSFALAPEQSRAEYFAAFSLGTSVQFIAGPALVTLGVVDHGTAGWLVLAVAFLVAGVLARPAAAAAGKRLASPGASAAEAGSAGPATGSAAAEPSGGDGA
jgi:MFS family permease